jgi:hypothetical protein|tara:strand:+ start:1041 stop:1229 length:189 start_codon:yes stop_codon:yes gene_type:complete
MNKQEKKVLEEMMEQLRQDDTTHHKIQKDIKLIKDSLLKSPQRPQKKCCSISRNIFKKLMRK